MMENAMIIPDPPCLKRPWSTPVAASVCVKATERYYWNRAKRRRQLARSGSIWKKELNMLIRNAPGNLFSNEKHMTFQMHDGLSAVMLVEPLINHWDFTPDVSWPIFWGWAPIRYNKHQKTCWHALNDIILNVLICGVLLWSGNRKICRNVVWEPTFFDPQLLGVASLDMYKYLLLRYACSDFSWYWST